MMGNRAQGFWVEWGVVDRCIGLAVAVTLMARDVNQRMRLVRTGLWIAGCVVLAVPRRVAVAGHWCGVVEYRAPLRSPCYYLVAAAPGADGLRIDDFEHVAVLSVALASVIAAVVAMMVVVFVVMVLVLVMVGDQARQTSWYRFQSVVW